MDLIHFQIRNIGRCIRYVDGTYGSIVPVSKPEHHYRYRTPMQRSCHWRKNMYEQPVQHTHVLLALVWLLVNKKICSRDPCLRSLF